MIRCLDCQHLIEEKQGIPMKCKAFPDEIPDYYAELRNEDKNSKDIPCTNGYAYKSGRVYHCLSFPSSSIRRTEFDYRLKLIRTFIDEYVNADDYRDMFPWEHCCMAFFEIKSSLTREKLNKHKDYKSVLKCYYNDTVYFFGINIPEPVVTDEMLRDGKWFIYNWAD